MTRLYFRLCCDDVIRTRRALRLRTDRVCQDSRPEHSGCSLFNTAVCSLQQAPSFKSTYITAELALLFSQSDSEEEFEGFSEEEEEEEDEGGFCSRPPKATVGRLHCLFMLFSFNKTTLRLSDSCRQWSRTRTPTWTLASTPTAKRRRKRRTRRHGHRRRGGAS